MQTESALQNLQIYNQPAVASHYASLNYLTACERHLFTSYLKPGMSILDLGVGGGRTTPYLSRIASRYVGLDLAEEMVRACRRKFPGQEFVAGDASDLHEFEDAAFEAVIMAFNGLDYILPAEKRRQCLGECWRVLQPGGVLIFSSHNPRAVLVRPAWDAERIRMLARRYASEGSLGFSLGVGLLTALKSLHSAARAGVTSVSRMMHRLHTPAFWRGEGYLFDPAHGGLRTHCWVPDRVVAEVSQFGFRLQMLAGDDYPRKSGSFTTDWYYYVFQKPSVPANGVMCA